MLKSLVHELYPKSFLLIDSRITYTLLLHTMHTRTKFITIVISKLNLSRISDQNGARPDHGPYLSDQYSARTDQRGAT
jgi:hypothetical protein